MEIDLEGLQHALTHLRRGRGRPYPTELRRQLIETAQQLRDGGWTWVAIGECFGMSAKSLRALMMRWMDRLDEVEPKPVTVRSLPIPPPPANASPNSGVTIISPRGWRIEGLGVDDVPRVLAKLPC